MVRTIPYRRPRPRTADRLPQVVIATLGVLVVLLGAALAYITTGTHLVQCEVVTVATLDQDGEPFTVCWDVITNERVA